MNLINTNEATCIGMGTFTGNITKEMLSTTNCETQVLGDSVILNY